MSPWHLWPPFLCDYAVGLGQRARLHGRPFGWGGQRARERPLGGRRVKFEDYRNIKNPTGGPAIYSLF